MRYRTGKIMVTRQGTALFWEFKSSKKKCFCGTEVIAAFVLWGFGNNSGCVSKFECQFGVFGWLFLVGLFFNYPKNLHPGERMHIKIFFCLEGVTGLHSSLTSVPWPSACACTLSLSVCSGSLVTQLSGKLIHSLWDKSNTNHFQDTSLTGASLKCPLWCLSVCPCSATEQCLRAPSLEAVSSPSRGLSGPCS